MHNAPFLSINPALRLCEPEGLAAAGLENPLAEPVRDDLVETVKTSSTSKMADQRVSEWFPALGLSRQIGI
jgi:hypothetical protein